jgi:hypothetical protein
MVSKKLFNINKIEIFCESVKKISAKQIPKSQNRPTVEKQVFQDIAMSANS